MPDRAGCVIKQNLKAKVLPESLCVINWQYPQDLNRTVVVLSSHLLLLKSEIPFSVKILEEEKQATVSTLKR